MRCGVLSTCAMPGCQLFCAAPSRPFLLVLLPGTPTAQRPQAHTPRCAAAHRPEMNAPDRQEKFVVPEGVKK